MTVKLLIEHRLECLSFKGCCTGSSESTHVKIPHCWKITCRGSYLFSASTRVETTTRVTRVTPKPTTGGDLVPVTLVPGGPLILPLYEEELANAIKIGSRVVRGRDWVWRDQVVYDLFIFMPTVRRSYLDKLGINHVI